MVGLNLFAPLIYSALILRTSTMSVGFSNIALHICLGEEYKIFFHEKIFQTAWSFSWAFILGKEVEGLGTI